MSLYILKNSSIIGCSLVCLTVHAFSLAGASWQVNLQGATIANQYTYDRGHQDPNHELTWINAINKTELDHVNTFQFNSGSLDNLSMQVTPPDFASADNCMEVFYKNEQSTAALNTPVSLKQLFPDMTGPDNQDPIHLTAIPYTAPASQPQACPMPSALSANTVLSVFDSNPNEIPVIPSQTPVLECDLTGKKTVNDLPITTGNGCDLEKPSWSLISSANNSADTQYYLKYSGPLVNMVADANTKKATILIKLANDADIQFPITTQYVEFPVSTPVNVGQCQNELTAYNASPDLTKFPLADCGLNTAAHFFDTTSDAYQRSYTYSEPLSQPIWVTGFGRIDGTAAIQKYLAPNPLSGHVDRPCHSDSNRGSIDKANCFIPGSDPSLAGQGGDYVRYAQWRLDTSLLGLSSSYVPKDAHYQANKSIAKYEGTDPAIAVIGVTVSDTPMRNRGTVQLNVAQFGQKGARAANNTPVIVNDFKQVGSWMDASDGADIGSDGANEQNLYYQITDDSAKLEAQNQYLHNVTLLQGNVGGIMLGMYGVTRDGIDNAVVDGVFVPRIIQVPNAAAYDPYGATHGLVSTRACPRYFQGSETDTAMPSLSNATVQNVRVFALTSPSVQATEPNYLASLVSIGIAGGGYYCDTHFDTKTLAPSFTFGPFNLHSLQSDIAPQEPFAFYHQTGTVTGTSTPVNVTWKMIDFSQNPTTAAKYYTSGSGALALYKYVCPLESTVSTPLCMQQIGSNAAAPVLANADNVIAVTALPAASVSSMITYPHT
jgi:hypothetical protein